MLVLLTEIAIQATIQEYQVNYFFLGSLSLGGILPIIYILAFLHIAKKRSWYLFILSMLTIAVSLATLLRSSHFNPNIEMLLNANHSIPECGRRDPTMFCTLPSTRSRVFSITSMDLGVSSSLGPILVISTVVLGILLMDQVRLHRLPTIQTFLKRSLRSITQSHKNELSDTMKVRRTIFFTFLWMFYLLFWALYIALFAKYFRILLDNRGRVPKQWTFGQIVAITVWIPALFEYGYLEARKSLPRVFFGDVTQLP